MDLVGELNRLAGIPEKDRIGAAGAANLWAGTTGLELVGALNVKAGLAVNGTSLELNGVLQRLGLANRDQGGFTVATDAAGNPLLQNVLRLPGISGNYVSTPDSAATSITGDIDIRVKVALDTWRPAGAQALVAKYGSSNPSNQRSYMFWVNSVGTLSLWHSADGATGTQKTSTAAINTADGSAQLPNGAVKWVRATLDVDNGAAGYDVKFYTSDDGSTWTQLGTTVTTAVPTSIFDGTAPLEVGSYNTGGNERLVGHVYYAEVRNGINGPIVAAFDATTVPVRGDRLPTTVSVLPVNQLSLNQASIETDATGWSAENNCTLARTVAVAYDGAAALGLTSTAATTQMRAISPISGATDVVAAPGQQWTAVAQARSATVSRTFKVEMRWGTATGAFVSGTISPGVATTTTGWVKQSITATAPAGTERVRMKVTFDSPAAAGEVHYVDGAGIFSDPTGTSTEYVRPGSEWTVNGADWWWGTYTGTQRYTQAIQLDEQYVYFPGTTGNYASTPDSAALSITGDIDIRAKVAADDWTPAADQAVVTKYNYNTAQRSYELMLRQNGFIGYRSSTTGAAATVDTFSSVAAPFTDGAPGWIRVTHDVDNGAAGNTVTFYTSTDGVTWTQLGATRTTAGVTSIFDSTQQVEVGSRAGGFESFAGKVYYAEIRNGIGGTVVGSFRSHNSRATAIRTPTTLIGGNGETWTMNGSAWSWSPTVSALITAPDSAALSITGDLDLRARITIPDAVPTQAVISKRTGATGGYQLRIQATGILELTWGDGVASQFRSSTAGIAPGITTWVRATLDVDNGAVGHDAKFYTSSDGVTWTQLGATVTTSLTTAIGDDTTALEIGTTPVSTQHYAGTIHYAEIRNGIGGTVVGVFNPGILKYPSDQTPTTLKSPTGETYTITGSGWRWVEQ